MEDRQCSCPRSWAAPAPGPLPLLGRSRSWAVLCLFSLLSVLATSSPVSAQGSPSSGSYTLIFSGPTCTIFSGHVTDRSPAPVVTTGSQGGINYGYYAFASGGQSSYSDCTGSVHVDCQWSDPNNPADPPPTSVIVEQVCTTSWNGDAATGYCDPALSGGTPDPGNNIYWKRMTLYTVVPNTGQSVSIPDISPSAHGSIAQGYGNAGAYVGYYVTIIPVTLSLNGTTKDAAGNNNILIGQRCTGSLSASPATLSGFQWTVPGQVFGKFNVASDQSWAFASNLYTDPDWIKASPQWCWSKDETQTVSCTAQAKDPNGNVLGTVTGQTQVNIQAPDYLFKPSSGPVSVGSINPLGSGGPWYSLYAGGSANGSGGWDPPGAHNGGRVSTPNLFRSTSAGAGTWQFVQLISPGRWQYWSDSLGISHMSALNYDGQQLLDNQWPYPYGSPPPYPADSVDQSPYPNTPTYWMEDSPWSQLDDSAYRYRVNESFVDYMMYLPPDSGYGSEWVPLHMYSWKWQADIMRTATTWPLGWSPMPPGYTSDLSSARCTTHPVWQYKMINANMHY